MALLQERAPQKLGFSWILTNPLQVEERGDCLSRRLNVSLIRHDHGCAPGHPSATTPNVRMRLALHKQT